jgi:glycosyltransferase involved in cell wall biosynthesis
MASASILIRARNEARLLDRCLTAVGSQATSHDVEILLIDSGSTDDTIAIARRHPRVRVHAIPSHEFNYGATLNLGVRLTAGDFVVPLSAHCVPAHADWLQRLLAPLLLDASLAATFSRQLPWPDCALFERCGLEATFPPTSNVVRDTSANASEFRVVFSNAASAMPRRLLIEHPFESLAWAEDRVWATAMLMRGLGIAYVAESRVYHSHDWSPFARLRTAFKAAEAARAKGEAPAFVAMRNWAHPRYVARAWRTWHAHAHRHHEGVLQRLTQTVTAVNDQFLGDLAGWCSRHGVRVSDG